MDTTLASPKLLTLVLAATVTMGLSGPAHAEASQPSAPFQTVSYAGLDLDKPADARLLLRKIRLAAETVCGPEPAGSSLHPRAQHAWRACTTEAVDRAVADVGAPLLVALHTGQAPAGQTPVRQALASR